MNNEEEILDWWNDGDEDDEIIILDSCPNCGEIYDEIDPEYQICSFCKYKNNPPKLDL